jgi:predicted ester cyclase
MVITRLIFRGTHTGELMGIPPTGRSVVMHSMYADRVVDGKIAERWSLFDQLGMLQQLGVIPAPER